MLKFPGHRYDLSTNEQEAQAQLLLDFRQEACFVPCDTEEPISTYCSIAHKQSRARNVYSSMPCDSQVASHNLTFNITIPPGCIAAAELKHGKVTYLCWRRQDLFQQRGGEEQELH